MGPHPSLVILSKYITVLSIIFMKTSSSIYNLQVKFIHECEVPPTPVFYSIVFCFSYICYLSIFGVVVMSIWPQIDSPPPIINILVKTVRKRLRYISQLLFQKTLPLPKEYHIVHSGESICERDLQKMQPLNLVKNKEALQLKFPMWSNLFVKRIYKGMQIQLLNLMKNN